MCTYKMIKENINSQHSLHMLQIDWCTLLSQIFGIPIEGKTLVWVWVEDLDFMYQLHLKVTNTTDPVVYETFRLVAVLKLFSGWKVPENVIRQSEYCISTVMADISRLLTLAHIKQLTPAQSTQLRNARTKACRIKFKNLK